MNLSDDEKKEIEAKMDAAVVELEKVARVAENARRAFWGIAAGFLTTPISIAWGGWVVLHLWAWFAPASLGAVGYAQACGFDVVIGYVTCQCRPSLREDEDVPPVSTTLKRTAIRGFAEPAFFLLVGYLVHLAGSR